MKLLLVVCALVMIISHGESARLYSLSDVLHAYAAGLSSGNDDVAATNEVLNVPTPLKNCDNSSCNTVCRALGFNHGTCSSPTTCHCYN